MTEPMKPIIYGGVEVNQNDIASKKIVKKNGETKYIINLKNGVSINYPAQPKENNARIDTSVWTAEVWNLNNGQITGNPKEADSIGLYDCKNCNVDVADGHIDSVRFSNSDGKAQNKITMDENEAFRKYDF